MNIFSASAPGLSYPAPKGTDQLGIRPEHITLSQAGTGHVDGVVDVIEYLGSDTFIILDCGLYGRLTARINGATDFNPGDTCGLNFQNQRVHYFNDKGCSLPR